MLDELAMKEQLKELVRLFFEDKKQLDSYKKSTEEYNEKIKESMNILNITEFEDEDNGLIAKIGTQNRESFNEEKLINKLHELNVDGVIKTKEYVDMDALENAIYNELLDASELTGCKEVKIVKTLKVSKMKGR